jgi:tetratricopeptide (TPR) repeat protein
VRRIVVGPATSASRRSLLPTPVVLPGAPLSEGGEGGAAISEHEAAQIATVYARLDRTDHYTLLGVAATADVKEIKRAYYPLAKLHHPDRFFRRDVGALGPKIEAIFRALTAALETLGDAERRAAYDVYLRDLLKSRITRRSAEALEASGDYRAASVVWMRVVAALPADAYSHHRLAYALLRARAEFPAAIEAVARAIALDPTRAEYRLTAASLYLASGLERKALAELEAACELEVDRADIAGLHAAVAARCSRV